MGIFNANKSEDDLKTLSEKDIQKKLYGEVVPESDEKVQPDEPALEIQMEQTQESQESEGESLSPVEESPRDLFGDQLEEASSQMPTPKLDSGAVPSPNPSENRDTLDQSRIQDWLKEENQAVQATAPRPDYLNTAKNGKSVSSTKPKGKLGRFLKPLGKGLLSGLQYFGALLLGILLMLDFRKPKAKIFWTVIGILVFVTLLFYGIHSLNERRDEGMNLPTSKIRVPVEKPKMAKSDEVPKSVSATSEAAGDSGVRVATSVAAAKKEAAKSVEKEIPPAPLKPYVIQVATYVSETDAERVSQTLVDSGLSAFVKPLSRPNGKQYFCVFLGRYANYDEAEQALSAFKSREAAQPFQDYFVRSLSS